MFANLGRVGARSAVDPLPSKVKRIFNRSGIEAHLYLPGNYIDSAGTQPAVYDQPVGLVLDAAGSVGAELFPQPDFSSASGLSVGTGWSVSGGVATLNGGAGGISDATNYAAYGTGKTYRLDITVSSKVSGGTFQAYLRGNLIGSFSAVGSYRFHGTAGSSTTEGLTIIGLSSCVGSVSAASVKEVTGIHASQQTVGYKPIERRGIVNLLTYSNDLTNAAWLKTNATVGGAVADPDGGVNARNVSFVYGAGPITRLYQDYGTAVNGAKYTFPIWLRSDTPCQMLLGVQRSGPADVEQTVIDISTTWQMFVFSHSGVFTGSSAVRGVLSSAVPGFSANVEVYRPGLFAGTLTAAQIIAAGGIPLTTTAPASSSAGPVWSQFDGDDFLSLGSPLFQMSDDFAIVAGMTSQAQAGNWTSVFAQTDATGVPRITLNSAEGNKKLAAVFRDDAGNLVQITSDTDVVWATVGSLRKVGNSKILRHNGILKGSDSTPLGAATFTRYSIGALNGGSGDKHIGGIGPVLAIKGTVSDADLAVLEKFVAQLSGVTL